MNLVILCENVAFTIKTHANPQPSLLLVLPQWDIWHLRQNGKSKNARNSVTQHSFYYTILPFNPMQCKIVLQHVAQFCGLICKQTVIQIGTFFLCLHKLVICLAAGDAAEKCTFTFLHWCYLLFLEQLNGALTLGPYYWTWPGSGVEISQILRVKEPFVWRCQYIRSHF